MFCHIEKTKPTEGFFSSDKLKQLVSSLIFSNIDYFNAVYVGISSSVIKKHQNVQNSAERLVVKKKTPSCKLDTTLTDLYWLKVQYSTIYKLILIVYSSK